MTLKETPMNDKVSLIKHYEKMYEVLLEAITVFNAQMHHDVEKAPSAYAAAVAMHDAETATAAFQDLIDLVAAKEVEIAGDNDLVDRLMAARREAAEEEKEFERLAKKCTGGER